MNTRSKTRAKVKLSENGDISSDVSDLQVSNINGSPSPRELEKRSNNWKKDELRPRTALILLCLIFGVAAFFLAFVYSSFPEMEPDESQYVKFPKTIDDAKRLGAVLSRYKDRYYPEVLCGVAVTYLFLQTFAIPGSIFLSIVSGYLFSFQVALLLVCFCSATGASFCYLLSYLAGRPLVQKYIPDRAEEWAKKVEHQNEQNNILSYIIFLRITPFLPNWFINLVSPIIGVKLFPFWIGTFFGVAPPSFVAIQAGTTLQQLTSSTDALTVWSISMLAGFALLSIAPVVLKGKLKTKFE